MSDPAPPEQPADDSPLRRTRTTTRPTWLAKFGIFALVCFGLGAWGLLDALLLYPKRGYNDSAYKLWNYLRVAEEDRSLTRASVEEPDDEYQRLRALDPAQMTELEQARFVWLESLARLEGIGIGGTLEPIARVNQDLGPFEDTPTTDKGEVDTWALGQRTTFDAPRDVLSDLEAHWATNPRPNPLSGYDLPSQWVFVAVGFPAGLYLLVRIVRVLSTTYRFDPDTLTLTTPRGLSFQPQDIEEYDRRRWDKFFLYVKLKDDPNEHAFDLYRHVPLEDWLLEMEKHTDFYEPPEESPGEAQDPGDSPASGKDAHTGTGATADADAQFSA